MASIFDKISDKAGDTRKSSTWYRNAVSSLGDSVTARDLSLVVMLNSGISRERDSLTPGDLQWQEERRKRKVRRLDFEVR